MAKGADRERGRTGEREGRLSGSAAEAETVHENPLFLLALVEEDTELGVGAWFFFCCFFRLDQFYISQRHSLPPFFHFHEAPIEFQPTYKYKRNSSHYDFKRTPAW